jgi:ribosomal protein L22
VDASARFNTADFPGHGNASGNAERGEASMTPGEVAEVVEEIAGWSLQERRAYLANLEMFSAEDASQIKEALQALWTERK